MERVRPPQDAARRMASTTDRIGDFTSMTSTSLGRMVLDPQSFVARVSSAVMSIAPTDWLPALVVGAGPAGLATAACLKRRGVEPLVLEAGASLGNSWRHHY